MSISHMQMEQMEQMTKMEQMHTREQGAFTVGRHNQMTSLSLFSNARLHGLFPLQCVHLTQFFGAFHRGCRFLGQ